MRVAAVCGKEVLIYGPKVDRQGRVVQLKGLLRTREFNNHGQALDFAKTFDSVEKANAELEAM